VTGAAAQIARRRANAQLLHRPRGGTPESVVRTMLAVQSQDPRNGKLGLRARAPRLTAGSVAAAFDRDGPLIAAWLMRGTVHSVCRDDLPWLHALTNQRLRAPTLTRLGQDGLTEDQVNTAMDVAVAAIADEGPLTRAVLRERIASHGIDVERQALMHVSVLATLYGRLVIGPERGAQRLFALTEDWWGGPLPAVDRDKALAELARRYLVTHGPATDRDLAVWSGLPLRDVRAGLKAIASEIDVGAGGAAVLKGAKQRRGPSPLRLISTWDDLLLGWKDRPAWPEPNPFMRKKNSFGPGVGRAAVVLDGVAVGTYGLKTAGGKIEVTPEVLAGAEVDPKALAAEVADLERFFG
jgi:hypothetical protein